MALPFPSPKTTPFICALVVTLISVEVGLAQLSEKQIELAVLGEARGEPEAGKTALAEALRNRNRMGGVYGYDAELKARAETERAVQKSRTSDIVKGADVWGTDEDVKKFKKSKWFSRYEFVCRIGRHNFYRRKS